MFKITPCCFFVFSHFFYDERFACECIFGNAFLVGRNGLKDQRSIVELCLKILLDGLFTPLFHFDTCDAPCSILIVDDCDVVRLEMLVRFIGLVCNACLVTMVDRLDNG